MNSTVPDQEDVGKLFVGGLSTETTKESLENYFSQFGQVIDSVVMKNIETGRSRGFGFVTFSDPNCIFKALQISNHELDGKKIDPKECTPRSMQKVRKLESNCKVFMGGLPPDITEEAIRNGMSKFGKVDNVVIMFDRETKKCRGFGFLSFELEESIDQVCKEHFVTIMGKQIECKRAQPRMNPKRFAQPSFPNDQNGFPGQTSYGHITPSMQQSNWSMPPNQALYNFQSNSLPNYQSYGNSAMLAYNISSAGYPGVQSVPYMQQYPANYESNDYSQSPTSYGPSKGTYMKNEKATGETFSNQGVTSTPAYQRYHPYKV